MCFFLYPACNVRGVVMKKVYSFILCLMSFTAYASDELKVQFPQENGQCFLAATFDKIGNYTYKETQNARGLKVCKH